MKLFQKYKNYIDNYQCNILPNQLLIIYILLVMILFVSVIYLLVNYFGRDYPGISYLPPNQMLYGLPFILMLNLFALYNLQKSPFWVFLTWSYTTFLLSWFAGGVLATSIQYTPFPYIDIYLIKMDTLLHFNTLALITFTHNHPILHGIFSVAYKLIATQLVLISVILPLFKNQVRSLIVYFIALLISFLIGTSIYYFFPSVAPAHFFNSPYFTASEHNTFLKFFQLHHYLPINSIDGGMIAFPSFHVVWAVLHVYAVRNIKFLFYPLTIINIIAILATMFLGWHYLVDVISGIMLAILSIALAEWIFKKQAKKNLIQNA